MSIKVAPSQERLSHTKTEHVTGYDIGGKQRAMQVIPKSVYIETAGVLVEAGSERYTINATAHGARRGDIIRFAIGANSGVELPVTGITTNTIILGATIAGVINGGVDRFDLLRYITPVLDSSGGMPISITNPAVVDQNDTPLVDLSATLIPKSSSLPLELVSSLASAITGVIAVEDIGEFFGLYTGAAASEVLACILPLGGGEVPIVAPIGTRISIRHMKDTDVVSGFMSINYLG